MAMAKLFIEELEIKGKKILMRVDFNVPLDGDGNIIDATRIEAALPSIKYVLKQGGALILMSHLGRPKEEFDPSLSLKICAVELSRMLKQEVKMAPDCIGSKVKEMVDKLKMGEILLLENLRFHRAEEYPDEDPNFAKTLASYGDAFVNDAFGTAHRKHSSTYTIARYFPEKAAAGYLMEKEIRFLSEALNNPKRPFYALIGGAKVSSKIGVLKALLNKVDGLIIGGGMSYTFLKAQNFEIGDSLLEEDLVSLAKEILIKAKEKKVQLLLPIDAIIADKCDSQAKTEIADVATGIPKGYQGLDIGPKTISLFSNALNKAQTIIWNGPVGVYELDPFANGSIAMAKTIANTNATTIVAGGDSVALLNSTGLEDKITHISTGGGATLEYIELGSLPGIDALSDSLIKK